MTDNAPEHVDAQRLLNAVLRSDFLAFVKKVQATLAPRAAVGGWMVPKSDCVPTRAMHEGRNPTAHHQRPASSPQIGHGLGSTAGVPPRPRSDSTHYLRKLLGRFGEQTCPRLPTHHEGAMVPSRFPEHTHWQGEGHRARFRHLSNGVPARHLGWRNAHGAGRQLPDHRRPAEARRGSVRFAAGAANDWFDNTLFTRLDNKSTGVIIIVMQRLHLDDLVGHVLAKGEGWEILSLPAIAEEAENVPTGPGDSFHRGVGDLLDPDRENRQILAGLKQTMGSYNFSAQYQQNPIPIDGEIFKRSWFLPYDARPRDGYIVQSWDTAMKDAELNDFSVCTTWLIYKNQYYLLDVFRQRLQFPALLAAVRRQQDMFKPSFMLIEDMGSGTSLAQALRAGGYLRCKLEMIKPEGEKVVRAAAQSALIENGRVLIPREASWQDAFMREIVQFPNGRHDDQVDSMSQFLAWAAKPRGGGGTVRLSGI